MNQLLTPYQKELSKFIDNLDFDYHLTITYPHKVNVETIKTDMNLIQREIGKEYKTKVYYFGIVVPKIENVHVHLVVKTIPEVWITEYRSIGQWPDVYIEPVKLFKNKYSVKYLDDEHRHNVCKYFAKNKNLILNEIRNYEFYDLVHSEIKRVKKYMMNW